MPLEKSLEEFMTRMARRLMKICKEKWLEFHWIRSQRFQSGVGMSYGKDKIEAIKGAIAGGLVNVLVTDVPTAELLLK